MPETATVSERITEEVTSWPAVEAGYGSRGEWGFRLGPREIGHVHGDSAAHFSSGSSSGPGSARRAGSSTTPSSPASPPTRRARSTTRTTSAT